MDHQITGYGNYLRAVISDAAGLDEFEALYRELQKRCAALGLSRALVVVRPESEAPSADRMKLYERAGFIDGFKLALVCASWTLYQACNKAERAANQAAIKVRAFLQEMEAVQWLTAK